LASNPTLNITQFGSVPLCSYGTQFYGFKGKITATDAPSIRVNTSLISAFENATFDLQKSDNQIFNISSWNVINVISVNNMFHHTPDFGDGFDVTIDNWNLSNCNNCSAMFYESFGHRRNIIFDYDATGTNFNGNTSIDLHSQYDVTTDGTQNTYNVGVNAGSDRTFIVTINWNGAVGGTIFGYGCGGLGAGRAYSLRISASGHLESWVNDHTITTSNLTVSPTVTTVVAISHRNNVSYFFVKDPTTGIWQIETIQYPVAIYTTSPTVGTASHDGRGLMLGAFPLVSGGDYFFSGNIGKFKVSNNLV